MLVPVRVLFTGEECLKPYKSVQTNDCCYWKRIVTWSNMFVCKLFVLERNTLYQIIMCKQMFIIMDQKVWLKWFPMNFEIMHDYDYNPIFTSNNP